VRKIIIVLACLLGCAPLPVSAGDTPNIVVTVPALHSIVTNLMEGVAKPSLLYQSPTEMKAPLTDSQKQTLSSSDMVIWVGPEHETNMIDYRINNPNLTRKELTVTDSLPVFHKPMLQGTKNADLFGDMKFWLDPKLAKMAISRIASNLARMYPDSYETILDNEIVVKGKLKDLERKMREVLKKPHGVPLNVPKSDILYLAWRFNLDIPNCPKAVSKLSGFKHMTGTDRYFEMMNDILEDLRICQLNMV